MATPAIAFQSPPSGPSVLRVVTPSALNARDREEEARRQAERLNAPPEPVDTALAGHIRTQWHMMRDHRNSSVGWNERLLNAQRVINGEYDPNKLAQIREFGGTEIFAQVIAVKCRGATALLREVYLGKDRPWGIEATPDPKMPDDVHQDITALVAAEVQQAMSEGQTLDVNMIKDRATKLADAAAQTNKQRASEQAAKVEDKLEDLLVEGEFYNALIEFLIDICIFPYAIIKGPIVRVVSDVAWENGVAVQKRVPKMFWERKSPFDIYWTPGVSKITDGSIIERMRVTRADLNELIDLPGYNKEAILAVLDEYGRGGLVDWIDAVDSQRAEGERRENPMTNRSGLIDCLEFHGNVQGRMLRDWGMKADEVPDELRDYFVQAWLIGRHVIKVQMSPNVRKRAPYSLSSFEKVPGSPVGKALPDILRDIGDAANAALRNLINNMSMASGPQVAIDDSRMVSSEESDQLFPWKRWHFTSDGFSSQSNTVPAINFFQPNSNANELLGVYQALTAMADEISAIPRYVTGSNNVGGAGRTASGLAMLMSNASKVLQMVASNIDNDILRDQLQSLFDVVMLTDTARTFRGDENIRVRGVEVAVQRETNRQRQIELLQATQNPIDLQIMKPEGRANLLRAVADTVGIEAPIVPTEEQIKAEMAQAAQAPPGMPPQAPGGPPGVPMGANPPAPANTDPGVQEGNAMRGMT